MLAAIAVASLYIGACIALLAWRDLWTITNLKTSILWVLTFAFVTMFDMSRITENSTFFRKTVRDTLSATVVLTFLVDSYTFSLPVELFIVPIVTFLALLRSTTSSNPEHKMVDRLIGWILAISGLIYVCYATYQATMHFREFATFDNARELMIPIILSLMFLPFLYGLSIYVAYQQVFAGLNWKIKDARLLRYAKCRAILTFGLNLDFLKRWRRLILQNDPTDKDDIRQSIEQIRLIQKREKHPPEIPPNEGWSPYVAKQFLTSENFITDDYHASFDSWWCSSQPVKVNDSILNTLTYYVEGDERAAKKLTLELTVSKAEHASEADDHFFRLAAILLVAATGLEVAIRLSEMIGSAETANLLEGNRRIQLTKEEWQRGQNHSFERNLVIIHID